MKGVLNVKEKFNTHILSSGIFNLSWISIGESEGYAILKALFWMLSISSDCSPVREV